MKAKLQAHTIYVQYRAILELFGTDGNFTHCKIIQCSNYHIQSIINANPHGNPLNSDGLSTVEYWIDVKNELNKIK